MKRIDDLFTVQYGVNLELNSLILSDHSKRNAINFVSRTSKNNGVSAIVEQISGIDPIPAGTLSVASGGSVMETFLQPKPYYSGRDLYFLTPRVEMSDIQKLYYCRCIKANKYRYNYGRQANRTLKDILIPDLEEIPEPIAQTQLAEYPKLQCSIIQKDTIIETKDWKEFVYNDIFHINRGSSMYFQDMKFGKYPYISATDSNNGVSGFVDLFNREGNCIVINYDGSIGEAFYQEGKFFASEKVVTITLKDFELNKYIAMFLITLIRKEKYRFNYGLKWSVNKRMKKSIIKLPAKDDGSPDYNYMQQTIKSISYSLSL